VAWISERKDLLFMLFGLLALGAYVRYARTGRRMWYVLMLAAYVSSLASKQMLVTFPFVLLLLDYWPLRRIEGWTAAGAETPESAGGAMRTGAPTNFRSKSWPALVVEKLPLFAIAFGFSLLAIWAQSKTEALMPLAKFSLPIRIANAVVAYATYVRRTFWPVDLAVFYPHPGGAISQLHVWASLGLLAAVTAVAIALARRRPAIAVGWFWFVGTLVPVIGVVQLANQQMSDRYTYFPLVGLFIAAAWAVPAAALSIRAQRGAALIAMGIVLVAAVAAWKQTGYWKNDLTLFERALAVTKSNVVSHMNLAAALQDWGRDEEALEHYRAAIAVEPDNPYVHQNWGRVLQKQGRYSEALGHFQAAVKAKPNYALGHYGLAVGLTSLGRHDEAFEHFQESVRLNPHFALGRYDLGNAYLARKEWDKAAAQFEAAIELDPKYYQAYNNLGVAMTHQGRYGDAAAAYAAAIEHGLRSSAAYVNLAAAFEGLGRFDQAAAALQKAVELDPRNAGLHYELGKFWERRGNAERAQREFQEALRLDPNHAGANSSLDGRE
jgi:tetratricopeptide (TPR) repeat protein